MRLVTICGMCVFCISFRAHAALPTLSELADSLANLQSRYAETTNALSETRSRLANATNRIAAILAVIEGTQNLRESFHGGRIGQYFMQLGTYTNAKGRVISRGVNVHLYGDGTCWTNGGISAVSFALDPEAKAKAKAAAAAQAERVKAAWEAANLPPDLAAIRAAQRQAAQTNEVTIIVEGN